MTVVSTPVESVLVIQYQVGVSATDSPISRRRSLFGIKATALDQDLYDVASALVGLLDLPLLGIRRDNRFELTDSAA